MTNKSVIKLGEAVKLTRKANELKGSSELQDSTNSNDIVEQNENFDFSGLFSDIESEDSGEIDVHAFVKRSIPKNSI